MEGDEGREWWCDNLGLLASVSVNNKQFIITINIDELPNRITQGLPVESPACEASLGSGAGGMFVDPLESNGSVCEDDFAVFSRLHLGLFDNETFETLAKTWSMCKVSAAARDHSCEVPAPMNETK